MRCGMRRKVKQDWPCLKIDVDQDYQGGFGLTINVKTHDQQLIMMGWKFEFDEFKAILT
jgi:hypothetical protein